MRFVKPEMQTFSADEVSEIIEASACGSVAGSCYGASTCGCTYTP